MKLELAFSLPTVDANLRDTQCSTGYTMGPFHIEDELEFRHIELGVRPAISRERGS